MTTTNIEIGYEDQTVASRNGRPCSQTGYEVQSRAAGESRWERICSTSGTRKRAERVARSFVGHPKLPGLAGADWRVVKVSW